MYGDCSEKYIAKLPTWSLMLSGGISGSIFWTAVFPMDVIKANMQGQKINGKLIFARMHIAIDKFVIYM